MSIKDFEVQGRALNPQERNEFRQRERGIGKTQCNSPLSEHPNPHQKELLIRRPFSTPPSNLNPNLFSFEQESMGLYPNASMPVSAGLPPCTQLPGSYCYSPLTAPCLQRRNIYLFSPLLLDPKKDPNAKEWCFQKQLNGSQLPSPRRKELALKMNTQAFHILMEG